MLSKKVLFIISTITTGLVFGVVGIQSLSDNKEIMFASQGSDNEYSITLDSNNVPSGLTNSYQDNVFTTIKASGGTDINVNIVNEKTSSGNFVELASRGMIYNFAARSGYSEFKGLQAITATFTGSLKIRTAKYGQAGGVELGDVITLSSGSKSDLSNSKYFQILAGDGGAVISSIKLDYSCIEEDSLSNLGGTYTGLGNDGYIYKLSISGSTATINSLDRSTPISSSAQINFNGNSFSANFTNLGSFSYSISSDGSTLTCVGGTPSITFYKVYNVEDFESYSSDGQGYTSSSTKYTTSGLRANYLADFNVNNGTHSNISGSDYSVMTSTDNTTLVTNVKHSGSKAGAFKGSGTYIMRYFQMNEEYGIEQVIGKGARFGFWSKGAYTGTACSTESDLSASITVYAYYQTPITSSNVTTACDKATFTIPAHSGWKHYSFALNTSRVYYGFGFSMGKLSANHYLPIDDVQIYTYNPTQVQGVSLDKNAATIEEGKTLTLVASVNPSDSYNNGVSWTSSNTSIATVSNSGVVTAVAIGSATITVTSNFGGHTATCNIEVIAKRIVYPGGTFIGSVTGGNQTISIELNAVPTGDITLYLWGTKADVSSYTSYNESTKYFVITIPGSVSVPLYGTKTYGNMEGYFNSANMTMTNVHLTGSLGNLLDNNNITLAQPTNGTFWDCDGTTSSLQNTFKRRYGDSWTVDTGNPDRITANTEHYVSGNGMKVRGWTGGRYGLSLNGDLSGVTRNTLSFWVYNPSNSTVTINTYYYTSAGYGSNGSILEKVLNPGWTHFRCGFGNKTVYNFQIADLNRSGVYLTFDNIYLF